MKLLIEIPTWLGDAVMATPAIENIANYYNEPEIILIGSLISVETLKNNPKVTETHILEKKYILKCLVGDRRKRLNKEII